MNKQNPIVMVVEDEPSLLLAVITKLGKAGIKAVSCSNATQAIEYLESSAELPDAIWLDYYLPDMDGLMFMGKLKENSAWEQIPVIVVSNSANEQKVHSMLALGAKKYILKAEHRLEDIVETVKDTIN
jgi:CheY-like chemotaxis protein